MGVGKKSYNIKINDAELIDAIDSAIRLPGVTVSSFFSNAAKSYGHNQYEMHMMPLRLLESDENKGAWDKPENQAFIKYAQTICSAYEKLDHLYERDEKIEIPESAYLDDEQMNDAVVTYKKGKGKK